MTLKKKILVGYSVAVTLMAVVVAWAVANLVSLGRASNAILRENYRSILAAENMVNALERQDSSVLLMALGDTKTGISQFMENEAVFLQWLARAKDNITIQGEADLVQAIEKDYAEYRRQFSGLTDLPDIVPSGKSEQLEKPRYFSARDLYQKAIYPLFAKIRGVCIQLRNLNEKTMYAASDQAGLVARRAIWSTVFVASSAIFIALTFSLLLAERISRPLRRFMEAARKLSFGDYSVQVAVETRDELGLLAREFNRMAEQLGRYHEMNIEQIISEKNKGDAILASIEDGLVVFDTNLRVAGINPAALRILNMTLSTNSTQNCLDILPDSAICDLIKKTVATGIQPNLPDEKRIVSLAEKNGSRHYLFSITIIRGKERSLSGIVLLLKDVTRLKEVEDLKSEFIMAASHELRTPLTSIGMSIDLLLEHTASRLAIKDRELLQAAHEEAQRMKALVNDLLDLSRIEAGRIELQFESVPVQPLLEHVNDIFKSQMDMKQVDFTLDRSEGLPNIRADANKITWVLTNLISNALRYVKLGGQIQLSATKIDLHIHFSVRDNGPGIPLEYQTKIFQKFVQVKGRKTDGSGLGLAICKEIIRAHGGTIWVESAPGQGSIFTFTVPMA